MKPFKKPGSFTVIHRTDVQDGEVFFVENCQYEKVAGPFKTEDEAYNARAALAGKG